MKITVPTHPKIIFPFRNPANAKASENATRNAINMLKSVKVDVDMKKVTKEMAVKWLKELMGTSYRENRFAFTEYIQPASYMIPLEKGFVVTRREGYSLQCKGLIEGDFFDYHLKLLGKVQFPCCYRIFFSSLDNDFGTHTCI